MKAPGVLSSPAIDLAAFTREVRRRPAEVRAACADLPVDDPVALGARLLAGLPPHAHRAPDALRGWVETSIAVGRELAAAHPDAADTSAWAAAHGLPVTELDGAPDGPPVVAQLLERPTRIVLHTRALAFAGAVVDALGWTAELPPETVRAVALQHEIGHHLLDRERSRDLRRRLGLEVVRVGRFAVGGHVAGASEVVSHAFADAQLAPGRSALALAAVLNRAAGFAARSCRPRNSSGQPAPVSRKGLPWAS